MPLLSSSSSYGLPAPRQPASAPPSIIAHQPQTIPTPHYGIRLHLFSPPIRLSSVLCTAVDTSRRNHRVPHLNDSSFLSYLPAWFSGPDQQYSNTPARNFICISALRVAVLTDWFDSHHHFEILCLHRISLCLSNIRRQIEVLPSMLKVQQPA